MHACRSVHQCEDLRAQLLDRRHHAWVKAHLDLHVGGRGRRAAAAGGGAGEPRAIDPIREWREPDWLFESQVKYACVCNIGQASVAQLDLTCLPHHRETSLAMESLPTAPPTPHGILFVLSHEQAEHAIHRNVCSMGRLAEGRSGVVAGQPVFIFDADERCLHGPFAAVGTNLDPTGKGTMPAAQLRFAPVVRSFAPLPEDIAADVLAFDPGTDSSGCRCPSSRVDSSVVAPLLLLFVLRHHRLLDLN
jgi:hypothetical protein